MGLFDKIARRPVKTNHETNRTFRYEKEGITLSFVLRTDHKKDLETFRQLLTQAAIDVDEEIKK